MNFSTFREAYDAYLAALNAIDGRSSNPLPGGIRDAALQPLSSVPVLAYDNHGYSYPVVILPSEYGDHSPELCMVGAPSGWLLSTLREGIAAGRYSDRIALDYGQGWFCINFDEVMAAVDADGRWS